MWNYMILSIALALSLSPQHTSAASMGTRKQPVLEVKVLEDKALEKLVKSYKADASTKKIIPLDTINNFKEYLKHVTEKMEKYYKSKNITSPPQALAHRIQTLYQILNEIAQPTNPEMEERLANIDKAYKAQLLPFLRSNAQVLLKVDPNWRLYIPAQLLRPEIETKIDNAARTIITSSTTPPTSTASSSRAIAAPVATQPRVASPASASTTSLSSTLNRPSEIKTATAAQVASVTQLSSPESAPIISPSSLLSRLESPEIKTTTAAQVAPATQSVNTLIENAKLEMQKFEKALSDGQKQPVETVRSLRKNMLKLISALEDEYFLLTSHAIDMAEYLRRTKDLGRTITYYVNELKRLLILPRTTVQSNIAVADKSELEEIYDAKGLEYMAKKIDSPNIWDFVELIHDLETAINIYNEIVAKITALQNITQVSQTPAVSPAPPVNRALSASNAPAKSGTEVKLIAASPIPVSVATPSYQIQESTSSGEENF